MTHFKVDAIEIEHAPVSQQGAAPPCFKLFGQCLIEPTDGTGAGRDSHEGLSDCSDFVGARPSDKHLGQAFCHLLFIPTIPIKELGVELSFTVSGHFQVLDLTRGSCQITAIAPIAVSFPFGATLSPLCSQKLGQFFAHDFFHHHLLNHVKFQPKNVHLFRGDVKDFEEESQLAEDRIKVVGGIDLQILGIGRNGHVGFNEPGSSLGSRTRAKTLEPETVAHYAAGGKTPPNHAITLGVGTIMEARKCLMLASGAEKADILCRMVEGPIMSEVPATALQMHPRAVVVLDEGAASKLKRRDFYKWVFANKWRVGQK